MIKEGEEDQDTHDEERTTKTPIDQTQTTNQTTKTPIEATTKAKEDQDTHDEERTRMKRRPKHPRLQRGSLGP
jgi:hypothetical protein